MQVDPSWLRFSEEPQVDPSWLRFSEEPQVDPRWLAALPKILGRAEGYQTKRAHA
jgi:hypothetical protein